MSSNRINVLSYAVILTDTCTLDEALAARLLILENRIAGIFLYHELLVLSPRQIHDAATMDAISKIPNIRLLVFDGGTLDILERIALRESIGDAILTSLWPDEEKESERLLEWLAQHHLYDVEYAGVKFASCRLGQWMEKRFKGLCKSLIGYAPELAMATSACYSRELTRRVNASQDYTTPVKLSYEVAASKKRILEAGHKTRSMSKIIRRFFWVLEVFGCASPTLLRLASLLCFCSALGSALYTAYVVLVWILKGSVAEGWFTSNFIVASTLTVLFFTLGLFSIVGAHMLRKERSAALPVVAADIARNDFIKKITSNVETE